MEGEKPIRRRPYKGIRMRKWGKWVAEIRQPNNRSRIWLGSYSSPLAAARAYDVAAFYLRRPAARLNFPEFLAGEAAPGDLSAAAIRKKANEVGSRVDAIESATSACGRGIRPCGLTGMPDLNKEPEPEDPSSDGWVSPLEE